MSDLTPDQQDREDMSRLASGSDAALNLLMDRHAEKLFHFFVRSLQNETDAAELAQETFVRIYQNRAKFDPGQKFTTWLYAIASNLIRDRYRWRSRHPQVSLEAENERTETNLKETLKETAPTPDEQMQSTERAKLVRRAIAALPEELRQPLILALYQDLSQADIAAALNCSAKAVEMRIYRARQQLRASLAAVLGEP